MKSLLIFNPTAGQGRPENALSSIQIALAPILAETIVTMTAGDAERAARRAVLEPSRFDAVLVAGGDGTVNEVINGILTGNLTGNAGPEPPLPIGILPTGTQNVLAHELGLPVWSQNAAADLTQALHRGRTRRIDLGLTSGRYFALMAGFGFDAAVVHEVVRPVKELLGPAAYAFATLGALAKYHSTHLRLTLDGEEIISEAYLVVVANAASYAFRQLKLAPFAALDDGWLDICVFERAPLDKVGFVTQIMAVMARRHLRDPRVRYYRARHVRIESDPPIQGQLDGDTFGKTPFEIAIVPQALNFFVF